MPSKKKTFCSLDRFRGQSIGEFRRGLDEAGEAKDFSYEISILGERKAAARRLPR